MDWIHLTQDRDPTGSCEHEYEPSLEIYLADLLSQGLCSVTVSCLLIIS
jgi:hypothetical protein